MMMMKTVLILSAVLVGSAMSAPQPQSEFQIQKIQEVEPVSQEVVGVAEEEGEEWAEEGRALSAEEYDRAVFVDMMETLLWDADEQEEIMDDNTGRAHQFR